MREQTPIAVASRVTTDPARALSGARPDHLSFARSAASRCTLAITPVAHMAELCCSFPKGGENRKPYINRARGSTDESTCVARRSSMRDAATGEGGSQNPHRGIYHSRREPISSGRSRTSMRFSEAEHSPVLAELPPIKSRIESYTIVNQVSSPRAKGRPLRPGIHRVCLGPRRSVRKTPSCSLVHPSRSPSFLRPHSCL